MKEFDLIARYFRPLAQGMPGALDLTDDAALLDPPPGRTLIVTADALVQGVHFRAGDAPADIARKALRVNLSDLAAKGAEPLGYLLSVALPKPFDESWVRGFADGLAADQQAFGLALLGGDTVSTPGPISMSVTAIGHTAPGAALLRRGAQPGDGIYLSGTLGDGALGLRVLDEPEFAKALGPKAAGWLADRYLRPQPRLDLGRALAGFAHAAADVSDGLIADLGHICAASGIGATVRSDRLPISDAAAEAVRRDLAEPADLAVGGDDYEIVFAAPSGHADTLSAKGGCPVVEIGICVVGSDVALLDTAGNPVPLDRGGFTHG